MQVERPSEALPPAAEAALQVAARVFAFESRMQDGGAAAVLAPAPQTQPPQGRGRCALPARVPHPLQANRHTLMLLDGPRSSYLTSHPSCVDESARWHRAGLHSPPAHSQRGGGRHRAAATGGHGAHEGSQYGAVNGAYEGNSHHGAIAGGRHGFASAGPDSDVRVRADRSGGRGPYVPPAARSARNPYAVPQPADVGRGGPSGRSRGRGRGGRTRG